MEKQSINNLKCSYCSNKCTSICTYQNCNSKHVFNCRRSECMKQHKDKHTHNSNWLRLNKLSDINIIVNEIKKMKSLLNSKIQQSCSKYQNLEKRLINPNNTGKEGGTIQTGINICRIQLQKIRQGLIKIIKNEFQYILPQFSEKTLSANNISEETQQNSYTDIYSQTQMNCDESQENLDEHSDAGQKVKKLLENYYLNLSFINLDYTNLSELDLSYSPVDDQAINKFNDLFQISKINISYTAITSKGILQIFDKHKKLTKFIAWSGKDINQYDEDIYKQFKFKYYRSNHKRTFEAKWIENLKNLIKNNKMEITEFQLNLEKEVSNQESSHLNQIIRQFRRNNATVINIGHFILKETIYLQILRSYDKLQHLRLKEADLNKIDLIPPLPNLEKLILENCQLKKYKFFEFLSSLKLRYLTILRCNIDWKMLTKQKSAINLKFFKITVDEYQSNISLLFQNNPLEQLYIEVRNKNKYELILTLSNLVKFLKIFYINYPGIIKIQAHTNFQKLEVLNLYQTNLTEESLSKFLNFIMLKNFKSKNVKNIIPILESILLKQQSINVFEVLECRFDMVGLNIDDLLKKIYILKNLIHLNLEFTEKQIKNSDIIKILENLKLLKILELKSKGKSTVQIPNTHNLIYININGNTFQ